MRPLLAATVVLAACSGQTPAPIAPAAPRSQPATHVSEIPPATPTAVLKGPFVILTINPGSGLSLAISTSGGCDDVTWFVYSGGGAAVGEGQTLCVWSRASELVTHGFSGQS